MATALPTWPGTENRIDEVTPSEGRTMLDAATRFYLGISAEEFIRKYDAGEYRGVDISEVQHLAILRHFAE